jgi:uncharacterized repeat protein (TIGR03803 family)
MSHHAFSHPTIRLWARNVALVLGLTVCLTAMSGAQTMSFIADLDFTTTSLTFDPAGNLYGTTILGGSSSNCAVFGCGTVFQVSPVSGGGYTKTTLYSFNGISSSGDDDGAWPVAGVVIDSKGRIFGTTFNGGSSTNTGTVFMLTSTSSGWKETILHRFTGLDGANPGANLLLDSHGNLYGTTAAGGSSNNGTVFMLAPTASGWKQTILHNFSGNGDGAGPYGIIFDAAGNIYGNTTANSCGEIFQLARASGWKKTNLHVFTGKNGDGCQPTAFMAFDKSGRLYGVTAAGGNSFSQGTVFTLSHASGSWKESTIYRFTGVDDGGVPNAIAFSPTGQLYGITNYGTPSSCTSFDGCSQVFKLTHGSSGWTVSATYPTPILEPTGGGLTFDKSGNLFGTTADFHYDQYGDIFELTP